MRERENTWRDKQEDSVKMAQFDLGLMHSNKGLGKFQVVTKICNFSCSPLVDSWRSRVYTHSHIPPVKGERLL